jgi:RNA polymerase sigma-70 factor, ECF subfamily
MVFNLYVMESYEHHEIATLLNISESTSRSNLARAKAKLREMLKPTPKPPIINSVLNEKG